MRSYCRAFTYTCQTQGAEVHFFVRVLPARKCNSLVFVRLGASCCCHLVLIILQRRDSQGGDAGTRRPAASIGRHERCDVRRLHTASEMRAARSTGRVTQPLSSCTGLQPAPLESAMCDSAILQRSEHHCCPLLLTSAAGWHRVTRYCCRACCPSASGGPVAPGNAGPGATPSDAGAVSASSGCFMRPCAPLSLPAAPGCSAGQHGNIGVRSTSCEMYRRCCTFRAARKTSEHPDIHISAGPA